MFEVRRFSVCCCARTGPFTIHAVAAGLCAVLYTSAASAQCTPVWSSELSAAETNGAVRAMIRFDADGRGPALPGLLAAGEFTRCGGITTGHVAFWDGKRWSAAGTGVSGRANALAAGHAVGSYYVGGEFTSPGSRVAYWDGTAWDALGGGVDGTVNAVALYDPDGTGPAREDLYVGGSFLNAGGVPAKQIARWDGAAWHPLTSNGAGGTVDALCVFDADGAGPTQPELYIGGYRAPLTRWDGAVLRSVSGAGVRAMLVWDEDGDGPALAKLAVPGVRLWDGSSWTSMPMSNTALALATFDPDGPGPAAPQLCAAGFGGVDTAGVYVWTGRGWSLRGSVAGEYPKVFALGAIDGHPDEPARLYVGGDFLGTRDRPWGDPLELFSMNFLMYEGNGLSYAGGGVTRWLTDFAMFDADGDGPARARLVIDGLGRGAGPLTTHGPVAWDGAAWEAFGADPGSEHRIRSLAVYDADGAGAGLPELWAIRDYREIVRWNGFDWESVIAVADSNAYLAALEIVGADCVKPTLIAYGDFTEIDGQPMPALARWTGGAFAPIAALPPEIVGVECVTAWDPDGPGASAPLLCVAARGERYGPADTILTWNGALWNRFDGAFDGQVERLAPFDEDGPGPATPVLVAGGAFRSNGATTLANIARWDGANWSALASGLNGSVADIAIFDADGAGPERAQLFAVGLFYEAGDGSGQVLNRIAAWDGADWKDWGQGLRESYKVPTPRVYHAAAVDFDGDGPEPPALMITGEFLAIGGRSAGHIAKLQCPQAPAITRAPQSVQTCDGGAAYFSVGAHSDVPFAYAWRRDGVPLVESPPYAGTSSAVLSIAPAGIEAEGSYDVLVTNALGASTSAAGTLTVRLIGDANCDGAVTNFDVDFFVLALIGDETGYTAQGGSAMCWEQRHCWGDINRTHGLDNFDIDPFVSCVLALPPLHASCP